MLVVGGFLEDRVNVTERDTKIAEELIGIELYLNHIHEDIDGQIIKLYGLNKRCTKINKIAIPCDPEKSLSSCAN